MNSDTLDWDCLLFSKNWLSMDLDRKNQRLNCQVRCHHDSRSFIHFFQNSSVTWRQYTWLIDLVSTCTKQVLDLRSCSPPWRIGTQTEVQMSHDGSVKLWSCVNYDQQVKLREMQCHMETCSGCHDWVSVSHEREDRLVTLRNQILSHDSSSQNCKLLTVSQMTAESALLGTFSVTFM